MSNGTLLVGQACAWIQMTQERTEALGLVEALRSSVVGQDLCEVCLVVREESKERSAGESYQEIVTFTKAMNCEEAPADHLPVKAIGYYAIEALDDAVPEGLARDVCGPPPRFEA